MRPNPSSPETPTIHHHLAQTDRPSTFCYICIHQILLLYSIGNVFKLDSRIGTLTIMRNILKLKFYIILMTFIRKATEVGIVFLFVVMVSAVFLQVVARYALNSPPTWTEELARYCQVWIIILASSICIRKGSHLAVDYLSHKFPPFLNHAIQVLISILMAVYVAVVTIFGWRLMLVGHYQVSPAMQINMSYIYIIFPLGGVLMFIEAVLSTYRILLKKNVTD
jgi:TRAP-type C4-dicarboxylate transport system permease small subunit